VPKLIDLSGQVFGKLTVLSRVPATGQAKWNCRCECGAITVQPGYELRSSKVVSCGCKKKSIGETTKTHGMTRTPEYMTWVNMRNRCYRPEVRGYDRYGALGIRVCQSWKDDFAAFYADMGPRPPNMSLDRIDSSKDYSPENCRWATVETQANNRKNVILVTLGTQTKSLAVWCRELGMSHRTVRGRIERGWDAVRALTAPIPRP